MTTGTRAAATALGVVAAAGAAMTVGDLMTPTTDRSRTADWRGMQGTVGMRKASCVAVWTQERGARAADTHSGATGLDGARVARIRPARCPIGQPAEQVALDQVGVVFVNLPVGGETVTPEPTPTKPVEQLPNTGSGGDGGAGDGIGLWLAIATLALVGAGSLGYGLNLRDLNRRRARARARARQLDRAA